MGPETATAKAMQESSSLASTESVVNHAIPPQFHSEFDNFDQFLNTPEGQGSVHTANGIMPQDTEGEQQGGTQLSETAMHP